MSETGRIQQDKLYIKPMFKIHLHTLDDAHLVKLLVLFRKWNIYYPSIRTVCVNFGKQEYMHEVVAESNVMPEGLVNALEEISDS